MQALERETFEANSQDRIELNGETFNVSALEPFGYELRQVQEGVTLNLQDWMNRNLDAVEQEAKNFRVMVVRNAISSPGQPWQNIPPSVPNGTTQMSHLGFQGKASLLLWVLAGELRSPIALTPGEDIRQAMIQRSSLLEPVTAMDSSDLFVRNLQRLHQSCIEGAHVSVSGCHTLYRDILRDEKLAALSGRGKKKPTDDEERMAACKQLLLNFNAAIQEDVAPATLIHAWTGKPDSGLIVYNKLEEGSAQQISTVLHRGVPDVTLHNQAPLLRAHVEDGVIKANTRS